MFFSSDCDKSVSLPKVEGQLSCHLSSECTNMECCTDVDFIPRSFRFYLYIDPCKYQITVGIEKFHRNISLIGYEWGKYFY